MNDTTGKPWRPETAKPTSAARPDKRGEHADGGERRDGGGRGGDSEPGGFRAGGFRQGGPRTGGSRSGASGPGGSRAGGPKSGAKRGGHEGGRKSREGDGDGPVQLFGLHAVEAALNNPLRKVVNLLMTENAERRIAEAVTARGITPERVVPRFLDKILGADTVHQGVLFETAPLPEPSLEDLVAGEHEGRRLHDGPIIILDQVTDPHNVGAILRSAAVFGARGLIMTRRNSPPLTGTLAKSASGALELVPIHLAQNLARAMEDLRAAGVQIIGLDGEAEALIEDQDFSKPSAIVMGAEGKGLRQLTTETCDILCRIEASGDLASLNVSNAAAVTLHAAARSRKRAGSA